MFCKSVHFYFVSLFLWKRFCFPFVVKRMEIIYHIWDTNSDRHKSLVSDKKSPLVKALPEKWQTSLNQPTKHPNIQTSIQTSNQTSKQPNIQPTKHPNTQTSNKQTNKKFPDQPFETLMNRPTSKRPTNLNKPAHLIIRFLFGLSNLTK